MSSNFCWKIFQMYTRWNKYSEVLEARSSGLFSDTLAEVQAAKYGFRNLLNGSGLGLLLLFFFVSWNFFLTSKEKFLLKL